jgi:hypothetical protein
MTVRRLSLGSSFHLRNYDAAPESYCMETEFVFNNGLPVPRAPGVTRLLIPRHV